MSRLWTALTLFVTALVASVIVAGPVVAPASAVGVVSTYDPISQTYDAPVRLSTPHTAPMAARSSSTGPSAAPWMSRVSARGFGVAANTAANRPTVAPVAQPAQLTNITKVAVSNSNGYRVQTTTTSAVRLFKRAIGLTNDNIADYLDAAASYLEGCP